jgi:anti-sigma factor RsiW
MKRCTDVLRLLADYIEGRLTPERCLALERHLEGCAKCQTALSTYRQTVGLLRSLTEEDLPKELRLRLRAFLDKGSEN